MKMFKNYYGVTLLFLLFASTFLFMGGIDERDNIYVKGNGSGTIKVTYFAKLSEIKKNQFLIGNYPFEEEKIKEYFSSPNNTLVKSNIIKNDTVYFVNLEINFKSVPKINEMKGFTGTSANYIKTDSGMVFHWVLNGKDKSPNQANILDNVVYIFSFEGDIKSTTGLLKDKEITYYRGIKTGNFNTGLYCTATIKVDEKLLSNSTEEKPSENKSCGLFGVELPIILIGGLVLFKRARKNTV